jgi:hypothetical protein
MPKSAKGTGGKDPRDAGKQQGKKTSETLFTIHKAKPRRKPPKLVVTTRKK